MSTMKALLNLHIAYAKLVRFYDIIYHYTFTIIYIFQALALFKLNYQTM